MSVAIFAPCVTSPRTKAAISMGTSVNARPSAGHQDRRRSGADHDPAAGPEPSDRRRGHHGRDEEPRPGDAHREAQQGQPVVGAVRPGVPAEHQHHDRQGAVAEPHQRHRGQRPGGLPAPGLGQMPYACRQAARGAGERRPQPGLHQLGVGAEQLPVEAEGGERRAAGSRAAPSEDHRGIGVGGGDAVRRRRVRRPPWRRACRPSGRGSWRSPGARRRRRAAGPPRARPGRTG